MSKNDESSAPLSTLSNRGSKKVKVEQDPKELNELNQDVGSKASTLNAIGNVAKNAVKNVTGLIANIAAYDSIEKVDYDKNGNQIVDGTTIEKLKYRSSANISENADIEKAIKQQKEELKESRKTQEKPRPSFINENDILRIIDETNNALQERIFGPMWENWTNGEDFLGAIKFTIQSLIDTFNPLMDVVDEIQEYVDNSTRGLQDESLSITGVNGGEAKLPLGVMAIEAIRTIIDYLRELITNIEMLAEEYTVEELNVLVRRGTNGSNGGTIIQSLTELVQLIIDCMKPYIHNLIIALILDAIDFVVDKLEKAGILSPQGPLKLIPTAITLVRAILRGDLEAIEEMVKKTITKMINIVQLAFIAMRDPSILWTDTDRLDKEIAVARYEELAEDGEFSNADKDKFFNYSKETTTAGVRHFLQKMKGETAETFNSVADFASTYTDLNILYKKAVAASNAKKKNANDLNIELKKADERTEIMNRSVRKRLKEKYRP